MAGAQFSAVTAPLAGSLQNGTRIHAEVEATNRAGLTSAAFPSAPHPLILEALRPGAIVLVGGDWAPLPGGYTTEVSNFGAVLQRPFDPMGATGFIHTWAIVDTPCYSAHSPRTLQV